MKTTVSIAVLAIVLLSCSGSGGANDPGTADQPIIIGDNGVTPPDLPPPDGPGCASAKDCPNETPYCNEGAGVCVECINSEQCGSKGFCVGYECKPLACEPGTYSCVNNAVRVCSEDGTTFSDLPCDKNVCFNGQCLACVPGAAECTSQNAARKCRDDGSGWDETPCGQDTKCVNGVCMPCVPGLKKCEGTKVYQCIADGSKFDYLEDCDTENTGMLCHLGMCIKLCELNAKFHTNLGCEYWAIDMDQSLEVLDAPFSAADAPYAIVVSNSNETYKATVTVSRFDKEVTKVVAPPKTATIINLPSLNIKGVLKQKLAYRVTSTLPIVAYQFNPLENVNVYSNDASLLLPTNILGKKYIVMAWYHRPSGLGQQLASNFAVVAAEEGETEVTVKVSAATAAGGGIPALSAGQQYTTKLSQFEVLNLESKTPFTDLTGSTVDADRRVAVYGGHICANIPLSLCKNGKCSYEPSKSCSSNDSCPIIAACDHLEEQIQPLAAWGKHYVVSKSWKRNKAPDLVRVLAAEADTHVTVSPAVVSIPVLGAQQYHDFEIGNDQDVEVVADKPILVGQYLEGQDAPFSPHQGCLFVDFLSLQEGPCEKKTKPGLSCSCYDFQTQMELGPCSKQSDCSDDANIGDPAFIIGVPVEQYRSEYVFLVPTKYSMNYVNVVAPTGAKVTLDGTEIAAKDFAQVGAGAYGVARKPLTAGSHTLSADQAAGIVVYGWDWYVSYGYPGGMNAEQLKIW